MEAGQCHKLLFLQLLHDMQVLEDWELEMKLVFITNLKKIIVAKI